MNRIVVIEDDPAILRGLARTLRAESFEVLTAAHGAEGYRIVRDNHPDLVILDLMLPGMNGYDICREMRRCGMATPILMLTAQDQETSRILGFEAGADDYVTKPFSIRELLGRVRAILRRSDGRSDIANQREIDGAREIQQRLMPVEIPQISGLRIAATCRPARIVGGDYFDVLKLEDGVVAVCIADVCGKGLPAAMIMANLQSVVKVCSTKSTTPRELCESVNRVMCDNMAGQGFITFFYAIINTTGNAGTRFTYCNAGHNPPILFTRNGNTIRLDHGGGVLGVFPHWRYEERTHVVASGDRILLYSDGITESRSPVDEEFGEGRLIEILRLAQKENAEALVQRTVAEADRFSNGHFEDDVTVLAVAVQ